MRMIRFVVIVVALVTICPDAFGSTIYVSQLSGNDANFGTTPGTAVATVTRGVQLVQSGDILSIGSGNYSAASGETLPISIPLSLTINGAGPGSTFLDGGASAQILNVDAPTFALRDLSIVNGNYVIGGGLSARNISSLLIERCHFENNTSSIGGGMQVKQSTISPAMTLVRDSTFVGNHGNIGGAIQFQQGNGAFTLRVEHSTFQANTGFGAAIQFQEGGTGTHTLFIDRSRFVDQSGGANVAVTHEDGTLVATVANSLFARNQGAAVFTSTFPVKIVNSTFVSNQIAVSAGAGSSIDNSILWFNGQEIFGTGGSVSYSIVESLDIDGFSNAGNVSQTDPGLRSDYYPALNSLAIDRGIDSAIDALALTEDIVNQPRKQNFLSLGRLEGTVDIGAFESSPDFIFMDGFDPSPLAF